MGLIRRVIKIGNSHGITLPAEWMRYWKRKPTTVEIEINEELRIKPRFE